MTGDIEARKRVVRPSEVDFDQILQLFTHRHTAKLYSRQAAALNKIIRTCKTGLRLPYLPPIRKIIGFVIHHLLSKEVEPSVFMEPLVHLISLHGQAFDLEKDYDEFDHADSLSESTQELANAMQAQIPAVTIAVCEAIAAFVKWNKPEQFPSQASPTHKSMTRATAGAPEPFAFAEDLGEEVVSFKGCPPNVLRFYVVAHSQTIKVMLQMLQENIDEVDVCLALVKLLRDLSYNPVCAKQLVAGGFFNLISSLLAGDSRSPIVDTAIEISWNLLELDEVAKTEFGSEINVNALHLVLEHQLSQCHRSCDKESRNEVLVILAIIARVEANRKHLARTPTLRNILSYATSTELGTLSSRNPTCTTEALDLEMKVLMWDIIVTCASEHFSHAQIVQANFLPAMLMYIDNEMYQNHPAITRWPYTQLLQLQTHALHSIIKVAPLMPRTFAEQRGLERLITFAAEIAENPQNLVEKQLARARTIKLQGLALQALVQITSTIDSSATQHSPHLIASLIDIFGTSRLDLTSNAYAITVLSRLIKGNEANCRVFRKEGGLKTVAAFLGDLSLTAVAAKKYPMLLPSVVECVWSALQHNGRNELYFISLDGVDHLLNLLMCIQPASVRLVLGCLADLLENPKALELFHEWRCPPVLVNPYAAARERKQANALSVFTEMWDRQQSGGAGADLKGAIYAVLSRVGFENFPYATAEQAGCAKHISSYVALRRGDVFSSLSSDQHVPQDSEYLQSMLAQCFKITSETATFQEQELDKIKQKQQQMLAAYYRTIEDRQNQNNQPIPAHINTHSTMGKRMAAKEMKEDMLKNSLDVEATMRRTANSAPPPRGDDEEEEEEKEYATTLAMNPEEEDELEMDLKLQGLA